MPELPRRAVFLGPFLVFLADCAGPHGQAGLLDFLKDGATTREDALMHLGQPSRSFENDRILTWRLDKDQAGYYEAGPGYGPAEEYGATRDVFVDAQFSLVLVFDAAGVLRRHALVPLKIAPQP